MRALKSATRSVVSEMKTVTYLLTLSSCKRSAALSFFLDQKDTESN